MIYLQILAALFDPSQPTNDKALKGVPKVSLTSGTIQTVLTVVFITTGAIATLIITIAGFQYVLSQGNPQNLSRARNTILYAAAGLAVSALAGAIVNFVGNRL